MPHVEKHSNVQFVRQNRLAKLIKFSWNMPEMIARLADFIGDRVYCLTIVVGEELEFFPIVLAEPT